jgi:hypothetical protein
MNDAAWHVQQTCCISTTCKNHTRLAVWQLQVPLCGLMGGFHSALHVNAFSFFQDLLQTRAN